MIISHPVTIRLGPRVTVSTFCHVAQQLRPSFTEVLVGHPIFASNCRRAGYERLLRSVRNSGAIGIEDHREDDNAAGNHLPDEIANTDQD
jgi:hypothetical protein